MKLNYINNFKHNMITHGEFLMVDELKVPLYFRDNSITVLDR